MAMSAKFQAEVTSFVRHSGDVATYEFKCAGKRPRYKAGQFVHLALDAYKPSGHWPESRVFSIASGTTNKDTFRLSISAKGRYTRRIIDELSLGDAVWMKGPYGDFVIKDEPHIDTVFIAGGTGMAPFVAFMEDALARGLGGPVWMHYGAKTPDLLTFRKIADDCARSLSGFRVQYYAEENAPQNIHKGKVSLKPICDLLTDPPAAMFYLCGPLEMIQAFRNQLSTDFGVPSPNIRIDDWGI